MGGSLSVQSEPGQGSTFELRVPVRVLPPEEAAEAAEADAEATTGETTAAAAEEAQRDRAASAAAAAATVFVATRDIATPRSPVTPTPTHHRFHVLIADAHPLNLRLFTRLLQMHDFAVTAAADGGAALAALQASFAPQSPSADATQPAQPPFDVAVLDMDMPVLRGTEVASAFRAFEAGVRPASSMRLPIFALTANVLEEHAAECIQAGCVTRVVALQRCC